MEDPNKFENIKWFAVYWNETISQGAVCTENLIRID